MIAIQILIKQHTNNAAHDDVNVQWARALILRERIMAVQSLSMQFMAEAHSNKTEGNTNSA